jgi:hypothetical protein
MLLYIALAAIAIVALVVVIAVLALSLGSGPSATVLQNRSESAAPVYLGPSQAQALLGSALSEYNASDLFNPASPVNMSELVGMVPQLYGNVTSGWLTSAIASNQSANASMEYFELSTSNASSVSSDFGSAIVSSLGLSPAEVNSGTANGLAYTYGVYRNSTVSFQVLYGWKPKGAVLAIVQGNPGFLANETALVSISANETP